MSAKHFTEAQAHATYQALDGRWNYGPASLADALRSEETGTYATRGEAEAAMADDLGTP